MYDLKTLKEKIFAGKGAYDKSEIDEIISSLIHTIPEIDTGSDSEIDLLRDIFASLKSSDFQREFLRKIDPEIYFEFGKKLNDWLNGNAWDKVSKLVYEYLNQFRASQFLEKVYGNKKWEELIACLIKQSKYTVPVLWKQRVNEYRNKSLLRVIEGKQLIDYSWEDCDKTVRKYSFSLVSLLKNQLNRKAHAAFLLENSLEMALLDITCLSNGIVNVMIPANSVPGHIEFILNQTEVPFIFLWDEKQLSKLKSVKKNLQHLQKAILIKGSSAEDWVITFDEFLNAGNSEDKDTLNHLHESVSAESLATIMYTSGTTGEPKGIMFSQINIVYKRFCRVMALPKIGDGDSFLAYLPLFHTFGRYLELMGAVFWGAVYNFMEDPSPQTMISNMKLVKPTIFISIPKKWLQLFEHITSKVNIEIDEEEKIKQVVNETVGGKLKWGLSAAGFLPPEVFQFFQKYGVELMSGFGMTEATGGITMTPPGEYIPNSLGRPLPGIEIKVADDGELLIRGDYVMIGYYDQLDKSFEEDGWLATGDIMRMDNNGFIEIIDRKKEIYKNIKGETVAPQKIENYFRDFENIKQVFLVGDHRPFNTVLIYPDWEIENSILKNMDADQLREYFASLIVTVNNFLAPYERIVNFKIIERPFSAEKGELTPKGTYKRRIIEKNFAGQIDSMYEKNHTEIFIDDLELRIPNWFLREKSTLSSDILSKADKLVIPKLDLSLTIKKHDEKRIQIGNFIYKLDKKYIDFQSIFTSPEIWIGNQELFDFAGESLIQWQKNYASKESIKYESAVKRVNVNRENQTELIKLLNARELSLNGLQKAVLHLQSADSQINDNALKYISFAASDDSSTISKITHEILKRPSLNNNIEIRRRMFGIISINMEENEFAGYLEIYLAANPDLLNDETIADIIESSRKPDKLTAISSVIQKYYSQLNEENNNDNPLPSLLNLISSYGIKHPSTYERIRQILVEIQINKSFPETAEHALIARTNLRNGFRNWLGPNQTVAVDMETGDEYLWEDVLTFEEDIDESDREKITDALISKPIIREAVFLFSKGKVVHLSNLLPGGVWVSHLRTLHNKSVYRVSIQTRFQGSFELVLNLNKEREEQSIKDEINLLILAGAKKYTQDLIEDFGGYWDEFKIWSGRFIPGDSLEKLLLRETRKDDDAVQKRLYHIYPFYVWNAAAAYINIWRLTNYKSFITNPALNNFVIPSHDYQTGTKIISLSEKTKYVNLKQLFDNFYFTFVQTSEKKYPFLKRKAIWSFVFAGLVNAEGEQKGIQLLKQLRDKINTVKRDAKTEEMLTVLDDFLVKIEAGKFIPKQLYFAIKRFHRWYELNKEADFTAQAQMINELYETYRLGELEAVAPETRTKLYLETVFSDSDESVKKVIEDIVVKYHRNEITKDEEMEILTTLPSEYKLTPKEEFFVTRLSFPHLKPSDTAKLEEIKIDGKPSTNLVVEYEDSEGVPFYVRKPISPKEISRLHQLFIDANLLVNFSSDHEFLVAISERGFIIGGLFYQVIDQETAHMEKIVVSNHYRRKGISDRLMNEFFDRMATENRKYVTTGFFRPEYFYKFDFKIERKYSGLVKKLEPRT